MELLFFLMLDTVADAPAWDWVTIGIVWNWQVFLVCKSWVCHLYLYPFIFVSGTRKLIIKDPFFNIWFDWYFQDNMNILLLLYWDCLIVLVKDKLYIFPIAISLDNASYLPLDPVQLALIDNDWILSRGSICLYSQRAKTALLKILL